MYSYRTITLVSRNINCGTITEDEFIQAMFSDIIEAEEKYNELYIPEHIARKVNRYRSEIERTRKHATEYAEKKWKTEAKRNAYVRQALKDIRKRFTCKNDYYDGISFFDFDVNPGLMGISSNCILSINNLTFDKLRKCFAEIKNNEYFKKALGWALTYQAREDSYRSAFRPQIKLILDEETEKKMHDEAVNLTAAVEKFYEGCTYWGD